MIKLWPDKAPSATLKSTHVEIPHKVIFPSARQALTAAIRRLGLGRKNRIALPEWSSQCVINATGKVATLIPMAEAVKYDIPVDAVLLYEQWGWTLPSELKSPIAERFKNAVIILDRVDSADIENSNRINFYPQNAQIDLISLSKILGVKGGGLVKLNGNYLKFQNSALGDRLAHVLWQDSYDRILEEELLHIHKNDIESLHKELISWLENNDVTKAIEQEASKRRENLSGIINSSLSADWADWMFDAFEKGARPGIVPLFRNTDRQKLEAAKAFLEDRHGIETSVYHFNFLGNPLEPNYQLCLAFPIHGLVSEPESIIQDAKQHCLNIKTELRP